MSRLAIALLLVLACQACSTVPTSVSDSPSAPVVPQLVQRPVPVPAAVPQQRAAVPVKHDTDLSGHAVLDRAIDALTLRQPGTGLALHRIEIGTSRGGGPLVGLRSGTDAVSAVDDRPVVLLVAGQQGDGQSATEALLTLARELVEGQGAGVLEGLDVVIVPRLYPDGGAGGAGPPHIEGDHLLLRTPEASALAALMRRLDPVVVIDLRESSGDAGFDVTVSQASTGPLRAFVDRAADEWFIRPLQQALSDRRRRLLHRKVAIVGHDPQDALLGAAGLRNSVGLVVSVQPSGQDLRITVLHQLLQHAADRASDMLKVRAYVGREVAAQACEGEITHAGRAASAPAAGWRRRRPCGYWLAASAVDAVARLRTFGVRVDTLRTQLDGLGSLYRRGPVGVETVDALIDMPAGSHWVPLSQPLAGLAVTLLEPDTDTSFLHHGVLDRLEQTARLRQRVDDHPVDFTERPEP